MIQGLSNEHAKGMIVQRRRGQGTLPDGGKHFVGGNDGVRGVEAEAFEAGQASTSASAAPAHLACAYPRCP